MPARPIARSRGGRRAGVLALALAVVASLVACEPVPPAPAGGIVADRDTFAVSIQPTSGRGDDVVLRLMTTSEKTKIGYLSFPVAGTGTVDATLRLVTRQAGFAVDVRTVGAFTEDTTYTGRPALGARVGSLPRSGAGATHSIAVQDAPIAGGRVNLALTTSGPYELEVVSTEGATSTGVAASAPRLVLGSTPTEPPVTPPTTPPGSWRLSFSDEFNGTAVDTRKWLVYDEHGAWRAVESPKASTCPKASNVKVSGGILRMRTQKANGACAGGQAQSGAGMNTWGIFSQAGGRFEARGRWTQAGNNLWGGFWTAELGKGGNDPSEIDTWEYIGKTAEPNIRRYKPAIHFNYTCDGPCGTQNVPQHDYDVTAWHTYVVEWEPTVRNDPRTMQVRFYLDGRLNAVFDRSGAWSVSPSGTRVLQTAGGWDNPAGTFPNPFGLDREHHLILSAWVGAPGVPAATVAAGYRPAGGHADLEIDYVRVYTR